MTTNTSKETEWIRMCQLWKAAPWKDLYSESAWKGFIARGLLKSTKPTGSRARLVREADVVAFLEGRTGVAT